MKRLNVNTLEIPTYTCSIIIGLFLCLLSSIAFYINFLYYHYVGNNYYPTFAQWAGLSLFLILIGLRLQFNRSVYLLELTRAFAGVYLIMAIIAVATNAAQYTPFSPVDNYIIALEAKLNIDIPAMMAWTANYPLLKVILNLAYDSLAWQMSFLPLLIAILGQFAKIWEYFCLLLIATSIGFSFYYFFPTIAPASILKSPYFITEQYITGVKFFQIHNHQQPTSLEGGMIALPSFHLIWAWLCLYLVRGFLPLFLFLLPFTVFLAFSCVLLGWHYPIDLVGSVIVIILTHFIYNFLKKKNFLNSSKVPKFLGRV